MVALVIGLEVLMKRSVATIILTIALLAVVAAPWADAQTGPVTFAVEESRIDLGEIKAGTEAVATFTFRNTGAEDVRIIKAKPS